MIALLVLLLACGRPAPWSAPGEPDAVFPHAAGYDVGTAHGADALRLGSAVCADCHAPGAAAGECADCHPSWPHPDGFVAGAVHGPGSFDAGGVAEGCADCHGREGRVAHDRYGCDSCHQSWPHPDGWEGAGQHGAWALASGSPAAACGSCHGTTLQGGASGAAGACTECHGAWPHSADYADPAVHGAAAATDACLDCHGATDDGAADPAGGVAGVACARCHDRFPHPGEYARSHPADASARGEGACLRCHAPGDGPDLGPVAASCAASCHGGAP